MYFDVFSKLSSILPYDMWSVIRCIIVSYRDAYPVQYVKCISTYSCKLSMTFYPTMWNVCRRILANHHGFLPYNTWNIKCISTYSYTLSRILPFVMWSVLGLDVVLQIIDNLTSTICVKCIPTYSFKLLRILSHTMWRVFRLIRISYQGSCPTICEVYSDVLSYQRILPSDMWSVLWCIIVSYQGLHQNVTCIAVNTKDLVVQCIAHFKVASSVCGLFHQNRSWITEQGMFNVR